MNYWEQIAEILGVELEEEFEIENVPSKVKITEMGLFYFDTISKLWYKGSICYLDQVFANVSKIIKKPWMPKHGDKYWAVMLYEEICSYIWDNTLLDYAYLKCGWLFRTKKEAEANRDRILAEYEKIKAGELE